MKIDSLKIMINLKLVNNYDKRLNQYFIDVTEDYEIMNEIQKRKSYILREGLKVYITNNYVVILVSSKFLRKNYFNKLDKKEFLLLYRYLTFNKIINISENIFFNSKVTSVDYSIDFIFPFNNLVSQFKEIKKEIQNDEKVKIRNGKFSAISISVSERGKSYWKIYNKKNEINNDVKGFYKKYNLTCSEDVQRFEFEIASASDFEKNFKIENTLLNACNLLNNKVLLSKYISNLMQEKVKPQIIKRQRNNIDLIIISNLLQIIDKKTDLDIKSVAMASISNLNKFRKSEKKKILLSIINEIKNITFNKEIRKKETSIIYIIKNLL